MHYLPFKIFANGGKTIEGTPGFQLQDGQIAPSFFLYFVRLEIHSDVEKERKMPLECGKVLGRAPGVMNFTYTLPGKV